MTSITGIPVAGLRQIPMTPNVYMDPELFKTAVPERSEAEHAAQIAKQQAIKAHTIFRVDGKIVAVQEENGWTLFPNSDDGAATSGIKSEAARLRLAGDAYNDFVADQIERDLRQTYGASLQVQRFEPGQGPTMGELDFELFGNRNANPVNTAAPTLPLDSETLLMLSQIREAQEAREARMAEFFNEN